jgi:hypothetical protein
MSLNHLVQGGAPPAQDIEVNNLKVDGTLQVAGQIQTSAFQSQTFDPVIEISSSGSGQSLQSKVNASAIRIGDETIVTYRCEFDSGTGAPNVEVFCEPPIWTPDTQTLLNLTCVVNCVHERGDGAWESLINKAVSVGAVPSALVATVGREDNTNFPVNKRFQLSVRFSYTQT